MTPEAINEIIAKRMGWTGEHDEDCFLDGSSFCILCRMKWRSDEPDHSCECRYPSYTTDYPALSAAERGVYGDLYKLEFDLVIDDYIAHVWVFEEEPCIVDAVEGCGPTELHARAKCLARAIWEEDK